MTIDLVAAGNRGLETIDSQTDFENTLNILNHHGNLMAFKKNIDNATLQLDKVTDYIQNNNSFPGELIHRPSDRYLNIDPGIPDERITSIHDPQSIINSGASRVFKFQNLAFPIIPCNSIKRTTFF